MKLVNNTLLAFTAEGVANSIALAHRLGLDTQTVVEAFEGGPLVSPWEAAKFRRIKDEDYLPSSLSDSALKDVHLALEHGGSERLTVLASLADEWEDVVSQGLGNEDAAVVTRALED